MSSSHNVHRAPTQGRKLRIRAEGLELRVLGLEFRVEGLGF